MDEESEVFKNIDGVARAAYTGPCTRFMAKVLIDHKTDCWLWVGLLDQYGFGRAWFHFKWWQAHVLSFYLYRGTDYKPGCRIAQTCENTRCVNPKHLKVEFVPGECPAAVLTGRRKVNDALVKLIRVDCQSADYQTVATKYGLAKGTIKSIAKRETWRHVD